MKKPRFGGVSLSYPSPTALFVRRPNVGVKHVSDGVSLVSFMDYDSGFFAGETCRQMPP
jgi:hypothetical protein